MSRRCAAEGASIFDQASPKMMVNGSYGFLKSLSDAKEFVELQIKVSSAFGGLVSTGYLPVVVEMLS